MAQQQQPQSSKSHHQRSSRFRGAAAGRQEDRRDEIWELHVRNLPLDCSESTLASTFATFGSVISTSLKSSAAAAPASSSSTRYDSAKGSSTNLFGFVRFSDRSSCAKALAMGGKLSLAGAEMPLMIALSRRSSPIPSNILTASQESVKIAERSEAIVKPSSNAWWDLPGSEQRLEQERKWKLHQLRREQQKEFLRSGGLQQIPLSSGDPNYQLVVVDNVCSYRVYHIHPTRTAAAAAAFASAVVLPKSTANEEELLDEQDLLDSHEDVFVVASMEQVEDALQDSAVQKNILLSEAVSREDNSQASSTSASASATAQFRLYLKLVGKQFYKFIIGSKGNVREQIEQDTGAMVMVPKPDDRNPNSCIVIRGISKKIVFAAKERIDLIVVKSSKLVDYTHFISIPLTMAQSKVSEFLSLVSRQFSSKKQLRIDPSIFQDPRRLHLTILMLRLYNPDEISRARQILNDLEPFIQALFVPSDHVSLRGLNYMNDDPSEVHVLYIPVASNDTRAKIVDIIEQISQAFISAELATEHEIQHNEKLHATLLNSKWRTTSSESENNNNLKTSSSSGGGGTTDTSKSNSNSSSGRNFDRISFDIRPLLSQYAEYDFGAYPLRTLELSRLGGGGKDPKSGYWVSDHTLRFPTS